MGLVDLGREDETEPIALPYWRRHGYNVAAALPQEQITRVVALRLAASVDRVK